VCEYVDERIAESSRFTSSKTSVASLVVVGAGVGAGGVGELEPEEDPDDDPDEDPEDDPDEPDGDPVLGTGTSTGSSGVSAPLWTSPPKCRDAVSVAGSGPASDDDGAMHAAALSDRAAEPTSTRTWWSFDMAALFGHRVRSSNTHSRTSAQDQRMDVCEIRIKMRRMRARPSHRLGIEG
jgi:hypothetical protein